VDVLMVGASVVMTAHRRLIEREKTSPPVRHHHYLGMFLLYTSASLGLLLHRVVDLYPFTGLWFLFWMRQLHW
jgi:hypothetical protein